MLLCPTRDDAYRPSLASASATLTFSCCSASQRLKLREFQSKMDVSWKDCSFEQNVQVFIIHMNSPPFLGQIHLCTYLHIYAEWSGAILKTELTSAVRRHGDRDVLIDGFRNAGETSDSSYLKTNCVSQTEVAQFLAVSTSELSFSNEWTNTMCLKWHM